MSAVTVLKNEIVTTLTLGMARGADVEELAADVLHELLEAGSEDIEFASEIFISHRALRKALNNITPNEGVQHGD